MKIQKQIPMHAYRCDDSFVGHYQKLIRDVVIPYQYRILNDQVEGAAKSHAIANFVNAGRVLRGEDAGDGHYGMLYQDSDLAKWLEAAAASLACFPDETLEKTVDEVVDIIAAAQDEDGYLNTYFTIGNREKRWTNLMDAHELYCAGHMMEAACAYYEATGKDKLLKVMLKNAECLYRLFVENKKEGYPGHPEVELALMRLYRLTGNEHCLKTAEHLINERGTDPGYWKRETENRSWKRWEPIDPGYCLSQKPVRDQKDAVGHSVRAAYLYTGMADVASETDDESLIAACRTLWDSIVSRRMYITGGIGSTCIGEAFSCDYNLPGDTAYAETCASIALMFFASRMLELEVKGEYADVMERAFYNTVLAGMGLDGEHFYYVNPLECVPGVSAKAQTHRHSLTQRFRWHGCACCPPNVARLIASLGKYAYGESADTAYCHMYAGGEASFANGMKLACKTAYPYGFTVHYEVLEGSGKLAVHIPDWSSRYELRVNGAACDAAVQDGYAYLTVKAGDSVELVLDDEPYYVYASTKVADLSGQAAVCRGPLVYCFEGVDNEGDVLSLSLRTESALTVGAYREDLLGGTTQIMAQAMRTEQTDELYSRRAPRKTACQAVAVPYYTWANRGENQMRVWLPGV